MGYSVSKEDKKTICKCPHKGIAKYRCQIIGSLKCLQVNENSELFVLLRPYISSESFFYQTNQKVNKYIACEHCISTTTKAFFTYCSKSWKEEKNADYEDIRLFRNLMSKRSSTI
jgi:hypothetical protein